MNSVCRDIFRAIHEGKWLSIEYRNKGEQITRYWIGIQDLNIGKRTLAVEGLHLGKYTIESYDCIYIDSIISSKVIEGSYCPVNERLVRDIYLRPDRYVSLFDHIVNLKILSYLEMCNRLDTVPYHSDYELVHFLDRESFQGDCYQLSDEQFRAIVKSFQCNKNEQSGRPDGKLQIQKLAINVLSIHTVRGLYVLAYRQLQLDVRRRVLRPDDEITICTQFTLNGTTENIRRYLDADDYELLGDFEGNQEKIKDVITRKSGQNISVDDLPYVIGLGMDIALDLHSEYEAVINMFHSGQIPVPMKAFFGDLLNRPVKRKAYPIELIDHQINLDQLLAIYHAMRYPIAYIQGPPGTGKTSTIINTVITAFFNEKTVLFASYNNHPINGVFERLSNMEYQGKRIPFPILRIGNREKVREALLYMRRLYEQVHEIRVFEGTLDRNKEDRIRRARELSDLLKKYEELLELKERSETLRRLLEFRGERKQSLEMVMFDHDLQERQLNQVNGQIEKIGTVTDDQALALLDDNAEQLKQYLYYTSARYIKKLDEPKNRDLLDMILSESSDTQVQDFIRYLSKTSNVKRLQKIFPIIATTCISAHRVGSPEPMFDMVVIDEASQCNTAVSLVPILRGESLMLVGDPQQLNPVIQLNELVNQKLKKRYHVTDEYDYRTNSVYKTFLACDAVSDEILLHNHYRCNKRIIDFNNKKYYHSRLRIMTKSSETKPLVYVDVREDEPDCKNTSLREAQEVVRLAAEHSGRSVGVITPFVNQKNLIESLLKKNGLSHVTCGTVHAFQGDEKDVILFSTAITNQTKAGTYNWLKNNKELINVATSRARDRLIMLSNSKELERLHQNEGGDDLFELARYVRTNGTSVVTGRQNNSRALGVKPFSTATEEAFLQSLNHALENIWMSQSMYRVHKEIAVSQVFENNIGDQNLFYSGRFDFVVYEVLGRREMPVLAIELDGKEHYEDEIVRERDRKKNEICRLHGLQLIRVENSYARRYNYIKEILISYFNRKH